MSLPHLLRLLYTTCLLLLLPFACRKADAPDNLDPDAVAEKFLALPAASSPEIIRVAEQLRHLNGKAGFLNQIAAQAGYPIWNKVLYHTATRVNAGKTTRTAAAIVADGDTLLYIPLVPENTRRVSAFILARLDGAVHLQLHQARDYARYGFRPLESSTHNADRLALQLMVLDQQVFGYTEFTLLDNRLFRNTTNLSSFDSTSNRVLQLRLESEGTASVTSRSSAGHWEEGTITHCTRPEKGSDGGRNAVGAGNTSSAMSGPGWTCTTTVQYYFVPGDDDDGSGSPGTGSGSGGGGGGGGTPPAGPQPCNATPELDNGLPPCPRGGEAGWIPSPPGKHPCDVVKSIVSDTVNTAFMQKVKALATTQNLGLNYEKTAVLIAGNPPIQKEDSGTVNNASAQLPDIPGQQYLTFAHTHPDVPGGTYSVFSFGDLRRMSTLLHNGQLDDGKFVAFLSTYKGTSYALTINDKAKLEDFFYYFNNTGSASDGNIMKWIGSQRKANDIELKYFQDKVNSLIVESDVNNSNVLSKFLDFMKEADLGVTLFESNPNFDIFTKLEKQQDGTITRSDCN